jgi:hypothetical protein
MKGNKLLISYVLKIPGIISSLLILPELLLMINFTRSRFELYMAYVRGFHFSVVVVCPLK